MSTKKGNVKNILMPKNLDFSAMLRNSGFFETQNLLQDMVLNFEPIKFQIPKIEIPDFSATMNIANELYRVANFQSGVFQDMAKLFEPLTETSRILAAATAAFRISFENFDGLFKGITERLELDEETVEAFNQAGWPIAPSMPPELRTRVLELHRSGRGGYASQAIMGYYTRSNHANLMLLIDTWRENEHFAPIMHIVDDAAGAHRQGQYTLSVPAIVSQIEAVLNSFVLANGLVNEFGAIRQIYNAAIGDPLDYDLTRWVIAQTLLYHLENNLYTFTDFEEELSRPVARRRTTRHTILHGITPGYDRPIHSLRAFVLLDALFAIVDEEQ